jgi:hypothetical protein
MLLGGGLRECWLGVPGKRGGEKEEVFSGRL